MAIRQEPSRGRLTKAQAEEIKAHVDGLRLWEHVREHRHNAGCGRHFCFHGAFHEKSDAVTKERNTPGSFIKRLHGGGDYRYAVLTPRKNVPEGIMAALGGAASVPAAIIEGLGFEIGSAVIDTALKARELRRKDRDRREERKRRKKRNPDFPPVNLSPAQLRLRNMAFDWMAEHKRDYPSAQMLAQSASIRYQIAVNLVLPAAKEIMSAKGNPRRKNPYRRTESRTGTGLGDTGIYRQGYGWRITLHGVSIVGPGDKHIGWATSIEDAKRKIDEVIGDSRGNPRKPHMRSPRSYVESLTIPQIEKRLKALEDNMAGYAQRERQRLAKRWEELKAPRANPMFTRGEKRKLKKKIKHTAKGAIRRLLGVGQEKLPRPGTTRVTEIPPSNGHRGTARASGVREDVISALLNQGFSRKQAARMTPQPAPGEGFTSLFKRAIKHDPHVLYNPAESERRAIKAFRDFHGADPKKVIKMQETVIESGDFFLVGEFFGYDLTEFPIEPFREVRPNVYAEGAGIKLAAGKIEKEDDGKMVAHQLFVMGGNQDLEHALEKKFGISSGAQLLDLGEIKNIWYVARKKQDGFKRYHYHHTFGEEGGSRPYLMYDRVHKKQFIVGGDYSVPLEGIRN